MTKHVAKQETLNLRVSSEFKSALRLAAAQEHRSMSNMLEYLIFLYCKENGIIVQTKDLAELTRQTTPKLDDPVQKPILKKC